MKEKDALDAYSSSSRTANTNVTTGREPKHGSTAGGVSSNALCTRNTTNVAIGPVGSPALILVTMPIGIFAME